MTELDALIERARSATVDRAAAERYIDELERRELAGLPRRRWVPWLAAGLAAAAAAGLWLSSDSPRGAAPVAISDRVTVIPDPDTLYHAAHTAVDETTIAVERGAITARLWKGVQRHRLVLTGGEVTAIATGTVYSLAVGSRTVVSVLQGTVEVHTSGAVHMVNAGQSWPPNSPGADLAAGRALLALSTPPPVVAAASIDGGLVPLLPDAGEPIDTTADAASPAYDAGAAGFSTIDAATETRPSRPLNQTVPAPAPTTKDRWRTARLLRSQGDLDRAIAECIAIADARDATWSPIALLEAVRIELEPRADPGRAIELAERMLREWPNAELAPDARELRCRALRQLGRAEECAAPPP